MPQSAAYKPEGCFQTTLEAARAHNSHIDHIIFEVTDGERVKDGAGYGGLTLLAHFTPDIIKLDMVLVRSTNVSKSRQAIARGMARVCQEMGIQVMAEGL